MTTNNAKYLKDALKRIREMSAKELYEFYYGRKAA